ncbi:DUF2461 domain-containing protein [Geothrix sp. PMB-07]|uniref:DUF2461 domain-containing protein n=1 Tax=Geothrix sp. PMB-07 TaxID=3068640 RepID=UPI0027403ED2|nr:DUF2461 domain-containing protein [Geothrix sp. PMB-07]WLT31374.1 DUF2461 domain-containing protein [Geothrix sp. PMB-07]
MSPNRVSTEEPDLLGPGLFRFLKDLKAHNDRAWFTEQKARYESEARDPLLRFIAALSGPLSGVSRHFIADPRPSGGSMFRIYRDTRFAKDKSPYKTHLAAHFPHRSVSAGGVHGPGFYLHLEPGGSFAGGGLWHPDPDSLFKVRQAIVAKPTAWKAIRKSGLEIEGEALKRLPQGFDAAHPCAEDLKLKDFYITSSFTDAQVLAPDFVDLVTEAYRTASPLVRFLCKSLDLPW